MTALKASHSARADASAVGKTSVQDLDAVSVALRSHFGKMTADELCMSQILRGHNQLKQHGLLAKRDAVIDAKVLLSKEVGQQKVLVQSRKTDFRITKAQSRKKAIAEDR